MKYIFILLAFISLNASAQNTCSPTVVDDGQEKTCYLVLTNAFVKKYQIDKITRSGVNQFNAVQTINGCWVTSCNSLNEFPDIFQDTVGNNPTKNFPTVYLSVGSFQNGGTGSGTSSGTTESPTITAKKSNNLFKTSGALAALVLPLVLLFGLGGGRSEPVKF